MLISFCKYSLLGLLIFDTLINNAPEDIGWLWHQERLTWFLPGGSIAFGTFWESSKMNDYVSSSNCLISHIASWGHLGLEEVPQECVWGAGTGFCLWGLPLCRIPCRTALSLATWVAAGTLTQSWFSFWNVALHACTIVSSLELLSVCGGRGDNCTLLSIFRKI